MKFPYKREPVNYDNSVGWAAVFHCVPGGIGCLLGTIYIWNFSDSEGSLARIWVSLTTIAIWGLVIVGIMIIIKWRYVLLVLFPLSIVGFLAFPFGTILYYYIYHDLWVDFHWFYPFNKHATFLEDSYNDVNSETHHS